MDDLGVPLFQETSIWDIKWQCPSAPSASQESVKEEDPGFDYELRQFRQRQEMERSAKSAWQAAQRLAEEAEKQRWGCDWGLGEQLLEGLRVWDSLGEGLQIFR